MTRRKHICTRPTIADMSKAFRHVDAVLDKLARGWIYAEGETPVFQFEAGGEWLEVAPAIRGWVDAFTRILERNHPGIDLHPLSSVADKLAQGSDISPAEVATCVLIVNRCKKAYRTMDIYEISSTAKTARIAIYLEETEAMNARDNAPALPAIDGAINAAHKALADSKAPLCAEDVAKAINGTKRATKPQIKEAEKQLKELYGLGILESNARTGGVSFYSLTVAPAQEAKTGNPAMEDDGCGACGDACTSNVGGCRVKEESPPVCDLVQTGGEPQTSQSNQSDDPVLHALFVMTRVASAARDLLHESEEFDFPDGLGRGAPQRLWDALGSEIEAAENDGAPISDEMPPADPALLASANRMLSDRLEGVAHALRGCGLPALAEISGAEDLQMATAALSGAYQMALADLHVRTDSLQAAENGIKALEAGVTQSIREFEAIGEAVADYMPDFNGSQLLDGIRTMDMLIDAHRGYISTQEGRIANLSAIANSADSRINSLVSDVTNTRRALNGALNEADRMRSELTIERQARAALQEQMSAAPAPAAKGYVLKTSNQPMRGFRKQSWAQSAAMAAARTGLTGEVFALVPVGKAVRGAEWKVA